VNDDNNFESQINYTVYELQYKMKLPFRYIMFTNLGLFAFFINVLYFDSFALALGITVMMSYPLFKLSQIRNYQINRLPIYKLAIWLSKIFDKRLA
jgi:hypothetical protein